MNILWKVTIILQITATGLRPVVQYQSMGSCVFIWRHLAAVRICLSSDLSCFRWLNKSVIWRIQELILGVRGSRFSLGFSAHSVSYEESSWPSVWLHVQSCSWWPPPNPAQARHAHPLNRYYWTHTGFKGGLVHIFTFFSFCCWTTCAFLGAMILPGTNRALNTLTVHPQYVAISEQHTINVIEWYCKRSNNILECGSEFSNGDFTEEKCACASVH